MRRINRNTKKSLARSSARGEGLDWTFLGTVICLSLFGLLMVFDSSQVEAYASFSDKYYFFKQQILWMILGFAALGFFSFFDYRKLQKLASPFFITSVILMMLVFLPNLGVLAGGAHRWLKVGFLTIQPTELIKLSSIIYFSSMFQKRYNQKFFFTLTGAIVVIIGFFQKDLGSAIVYAVISLTMYFISGAQIMRFLSVLGSGFMVFLFFILSSSYRRDRVLAFLDPFADPNGFSYHIYQVLIALGSGGLFGLGIGQSRQKFAYIPEVTTDSIFAVVGEEFGFVGGVILISAIAFLILRALKISELASDDFGKMLATGLSIWIGVQAVINLGAMVSLIPLTGVPLPFISYGGSALMANLVAAGILLNISKQSRKY